MIRNYGVSLLNWCTIYDSRGTFGNITNDNDFTRLRACFHDTYPSTNGTIKQTIKIAIKKGTNYIRNNNNHYCPFSYKRIVEHITYLKQLMDFNFSIEDRGNQYIIIVDFEGKGIYFRILVSWIRYLYEFPANMAMKDVYRIKDLPEFKGINIFSLSTFVMDSIFAGNYFDDHICNNAVPSCLMTIDQIKARIQGLLNVGNGSFRTMDMFKPADMSIQNTFKRNRDSMYALKLRELQVDFKDGGYLRNMYDWMRKDLFELRLKLYKENIKLFKNER